MPINLKSNFKRGDAFLVEDINRTNGAINQLSREVDDLKSIINVAKNAVNDKFVEKYVNEDMSDFSTTIDKQLVSINNTISDIETQFGELKNQLEDLVKENQSKDIDGRIKNLESSIAIINSILSQLTNPEPEEVNESETSEQQETNFGYKQANYSVNGMTTLTIYPYNRTLLYGEINGDFEFVKGAGSQNYLSDEYIVIFTAGKDCKIQFSTAFGKIKWENGKAPTYTQGYTYEIKIVDSLATVKKFK